MPRPPYPNRGNAAPRRQQIEQPSSEKLHKMLAAAGLGSRRDMEMLIATGRVSVNGQPVQVGDRVSPNDVIRVDGKVVRLPWEAANQPRILIYHKPEGEIVSRDDPQGRASVFDQLPKLRGERWIAVGRLDYNTEGLLIFTTNGELANRLMHPRFDIEREYAVRVLGDELSQQQMQALKQGVQLEDGLARVESISVSGGEGANKWYRLVIKEGRNREVRRLFEALDLTVSRLIRVRFGPISLPPRLKRGQRLELSAEEVAKVLSWNGKAASSVVAKGSVERKPQQQHKPGQKPKPDSKPAEEAGKSVHPYRRRLASRGAKQP
ncbi:MAG: pseudouridine synthase [Hydrogenophilaceae bacterium]|nr:pseudouridine synthase [Hydrogenophilaceae bacterium]